MVGCYEACRRCGAFPFGDSAQDFGVNNFVLRAVICVKIGEWTIAAAEDFIYGSCGVNAGDKEAGKEATTHRTAFVGVEDWQARSKQNGSSEPRIKEVRLRRKWPAAERKNVV